MNAAQITSNEVQRKYHLENFTTMSTPLLLENLHRLFYDIIMMGDIEREKIGEGTYTDMAMKALALDVLERLKSRHIPFE